MSIENITANILKDAQNIAETSIENANKLRQDNINAANLEAEAIVKAEAERADKDSEILKSRKVSAAELEARKMILSAKQDAIKKSFNLALDKLKSMPEDDYIDFLSREIIRAPYKEGTIILNKNDRDKIGEKLVKLVNEKSKAEKFSLSNETSNASGGFILKSGSIMINSTFEAVLDSVKDELTNDIANKLF